MGEYGNPDTYADVDLDGSETLLVRKDGVTSSSTTQEIADLGVRNIRDLDDVEAPSPNDREVLGWSSGSEKFEAIQMPDDPDPSNYDPAGALTGTEDVLVRTGDGLAKTTVQDIADLGSGGSSPVVVTSRPTEAVTQEGSTFGSFSTPWSANIDTLDSQDVEYVVDIGFSVSADDTTWFGLFLDGTLIDQLRTSVGGANISNRLAFSGLAEDLAAGTHTFEVKARTNSSSSVTVSNTVKAGNTAYNGGKIGRSRLKLEAVPLA